MLSCRWKKNFHNHVQGCTFKEVLRYVFILLPLLMVTGVTWTGVAWKERVTSGQQQLDTATNVTAVAERDSRGNLVAEFVSCVNCSSSAPVGLVWRAVSNGVRDVLLEYPDLLMDALAIWNPCPKLTVLVTSEPGLRAQRDAIRTTWGRRDRYSNCSHRVIFFMSAVPRSKQHYALKSEYLRTKDIVVQAKITASPEPSWSMSALLVEWVPTHVSHSSYVLRVTDDTYVNVSAVLAAVESLPSSDVTCLMYGHLSPDRTHLEDCAYMVKSKGFAQMQRSFADVAVNYSEGPLVTGRLAREAGLVLEHMDGFGSCRSRHSALTVRELLRKVDDAPATFLTVRGLSPVLMSMLHPVVTKLERPVLAGA